MAEEREEKMSLIDQEKTNKKEKTNIMADEKAKFILEEKAKFIPEEKTKFMVEEKINIVADEKTKLIKEEKMLVKYIIITKNVRNKKSEQEETYQYNTRMCIAVGALLLYIYLFVYIKYLMLREEKLNYLDELTWNTEGMLNNLQRVDDKLALEISKLQGLLNRE